jgi:hypothetical protein
MKTFDIINALFQLGGAIAVWKNVHQICRDKQVKGVFWPLTIYYAVWGMWNLLFLSHMAQWWSLAASILLVVGNIIWSLIAIRHHLANLRLEQR